jgi:hypothetical protein
MCFIDIRYGLVARISRSHTVRKNNQVRGGRGSIPRVGIFFCSFVNLTNEGISPFAEHIVLVRKRFAIIYSLCDRGARQLSRV